MKNMLLTITALMCCIVVNAQHSVTLHFQYGSVPASGYQSTEARYFGGILGGHVTLELDKQVIGFAPGGKCHLFGRRKNPNGYFHYGPGLGDTTGMKYTSFIIPVTEEQYSALKTIMAEYHQKAPYDYATFGMRCAAAASDILGRAGVLKKKSKTGNVLRYFYPKKLRKKMFRLAAAKNYTIIRHEGRKSRRWEKDKFDLQ
jgi:hypothetical protein